MRSIARTMAVAALCCAVPTTALAQQPAVITFQDSGERHIYAFVAALDGRLKVRYGNGSSWYWGDHGFPAGAIGVKDPAAITYVDLAGNRRIHVFAIQVGGWNGSRLVQNQWTGSEWKWSSLGGPQLSGGDDSLSAVVYPDARGNARIYVFARDTSGHLIVHNWNGAAWSFQDHGLPPGGGMSSLHAMTYADSGDRVIDVFCSPGSFEAGTLSLRRLSGGVWQWNNQGGPSGPGDVSAINYLENGSRRVHAFAGGIFSALHTNFFVAPYWYWEDLEGIAAPSAVTFLSGGTRHIYVFGLRLHIASGPPLHLGLTYLDGSGWHTADHGWFGSLSNKLRSPTAITYTDSAGTRRVDVFLVVENEAGNVQRLVVRSWDGSTWEWIDLGVF